VAALVVINLVWGSSYVVTKEALTLMPALPLAFARFGLAWLAFVLLVRVPLAKGLFQHGGHGDTEKYTERCLAGRRPLSVFLPWSSLHSSVVSVLKQFSPGDGARIALVGLVGFCLDYLFFYHGMERTTASDAAILVNMEAIFTALLGAALLGERLGARAWLGVVAACAGATLLLRPAAASGAAHVAGLGDRATGNALILVALACEALATVLSRPLRRRWPPLALTRRLVGWGTLGLLPLAFLEARAAPDPAAWLTPASIGGIAYLALGCTVFCYSIWYGLLGRIEAGRAAVFLYVQPLVGVLLGVTLLGDRLDLPAVAGGALIAAGIAASASPYMKIGDSTVSQK
jgi:drug/metabolite transporter (DMT)-like permease